MEFIVDSETGSLSFVFCGMVCFENNYAGTKRSYERLIQNEYYRKIIYDKYTY